MRDPRVLTSHAPSGAAGGGIDFLLMDAFGNTPSEYSLGPPRVVATFGVDSLDGFEPGPGSSHGVSPA
jgi:hypothetical protein